MTTLCTFFTFGFVSTLAVAIIATGWRYLPTLIALYQFQASYPLKSYQPDFHIN